MRCRLGRSLQDITGLLLAKQIRKGYADGDCRGIEECRYQDASHCLGRIAWVPRNGPGRSIVREVFRIVQQMKAEGISVLLVEQNARMSLEIADDAYVLDDGIVVYSGSARELAADEARVRALAGASAEEWTLT